jgi:hypothetical protein
VRLREADNEVSNECSRPLHSRTVEMPCVALARIVHWTEHLQKLFKTASFPPHSAPVLTRVKEYCLVGVLPAQGTWAMGHARILAGPSIPRTATSRTNSSPSQRHGQVLIPLHWLKPFPDRGCTIKYIFADSQGQPVCIGTLSSSN